MFIDSVKYNGTNNPMLLCMLALCCMAAGPATQPSSPTGGTSPPHILYQAPPQAGPITRVDGPLRGSADQWPTILLLSPEHTGLTTQEQPSLFWFMDRPAGNVKMVLTVLQDKNPQPLLQLSLDPSKSGIQRADLSTTACKLAAGQEYQWVVALIPDEAHRMNDVTRSAVIRRIDPPESLVEKMLTLGSTVDRAVEYAKNGIWYDALSAVSDQIDAAPTDPAVRNLRAQLCDQVNLPQVAAYDTDATQTK
jgi:hypothetical protein